MSDESIQDILERSMPPIEKDDPGDGVDFSMTMDEQRAITDHLYSLVEELHGRGFTANELSIPFHGIEHTLNARRFDRYEYDRIALYHELRATIEDWKAEQDGEVPPHEIAQAVEEMGRFYRTLAREQAAKRQAERELENEGGGHRMTEPDDYHTPEYVVEYLAEQVGVEPEVLRQG